MNATLASPPPAVGLSQLPSVTLDAYHQAIWEVAQQQAGGPPTCRHRLIAEAHDFLALAQYSGRMIVHWLTLAGGLRAKVELEVPVPCLPDPAGPLQVAPRALLGVVYSQDAVLLPQPGYAFVHILQPRPVWLGNVSPDASQACCLGAKLPAGIPLIQLILMTYGALSMQTTQLDILDSAGVLNPAAADWWQRNPGRIPLSREPFLRGEVTHGT